MAKTGGKVVVQGQLLLDASIQLNNVTSEMERLGKSVNNIKLGDKVSKNIEGSFSKILDLLPSLQKQLQKGTFDDSQLNDYLSDMQRLGKEVDLLARSMRNMSKNQIIVDSPQLDATTEKN